MLFLLSPSSVPRLFPDDRLFVFQASPAPVTTFYPCPHIGGSQYAAYAFQRLSAGLSGVQSTKRVFKTQGSQRFPNIRNISITDSWLLFQTILACSDIRLRGEPQELPAEGGHLKLLVSFGKSLNIFSLLCFDYGARGNLVKLHVFPQRYQ